MYLFVQKLCSFGTQQRADNLDCPFKTELGLCNISRLATQCVYMASYLDNHSFMRRISNFLLNLYKFEGPILLDHAVYYINLVNHLQWMCVSRLMVDWFGRQHLCLVIRIVVGQATYVCHSKWPIYIFEKLATFFSIAIFY